MALCKAAEGCSKPGTKLGFCGTHYQQVRRGARSSEGILLRELRARYVGTSVTCKIVECLSTPYANGFCGSHHHLYRWGRVDEHGNPTDPSRWRSYYNPNRTTPGTAGPCKLEGCGRPKVHTELGLCGRHYRRLQLGIIDENGALLREEYRVRKYTERDRCKAPKCEKKARSNFFCMYHAGRFAAGLIDVEGNALRAPTKGRPRSKTPRWKTSQGYVRVRAPENHPRADRDGMIFEHHAVMEAYLGRYLEPGEMVHHRNSVRDDNRFENLELRTRKTHPPGGEFTEEFTERALEHLKHNNPAGYRRVMSRVKKKAKRWPK